MLTARQAADRLGVSLSVIYRLCSEGVLPHRREGNHPRGRIRMDPRVIEHYRWLCRLDASQLTTSCFFRPPLTD